MWGEDNTFIRIFEYVGAIIFRLGLARLVRRQAVMFFLCHAAMCVAKNVNFAPLYLKNKE